MEMMKMKMKMQKMQKLKKRKVVNHQGMGNIYSMKLIYFSDCLKYCYIVHCTYIKYNKVCLLFLFQTITKEKEI